MDKDKYLSIPVPLDLAEMVKDVARYDGRTVSSYVRALIIADLKAQGMIDDQLKPIAASRKKS